MNERIDAYMTELKKLCDEYENGEAQLDIIYKVASIVETRLIPATREELNFTPFDGVLNEERSNS